MVKVFLSAHAKKRLAERGIGIAEVNKVARGGRVIEYQENGKILKGGKLKNGKELKVVVVMERRKFIVVTTF